MSVQSTLLLRWFRNGCIPALYSIIVRSLSLLLGTPLTPMYPHDVDFGSELFSLRRLKGATQAEVAYQTGIGRGYYSELESSKKRPPSAKRLERIVDALELSEVQAQRLVSFAVADKCATACQTAAVLAHVSLLVKYLVQAATALSGEKAARIEAILQED